MKPTALLQAHSRHSFVRLMLEAQMCNGPFIFGDSPIKRSLLYRLIQGCILCLRLITPTSFFLVFVLIANELSFFACPAIADIWGWVFPAEWLQFVQAVFTIKFLLDPMQRPLVSLVSAYIFAEVAFFGYYYFLFTQVAHANDDLHHYAHDRPARMQLARDCFEALAMTARSMNRAPHEYIQSVMQGWFMEVPLARVKYGNMFAWCAWAFFGKDPKDLEASETMDNKDIVAYIEAMAHWKFPPGFCAETPPMRLNLDPIFVTQRPFLLYAMIFMANLGAMVVVRHLLGFSLQSEHSAADGSQRIYLRAGRTPSELSWLSRGLTSTLHSIEAALIAVMRYCRLDPPLLEKLHHFHSRQPATSPDSGRNSSKRKLPVVFVHGIGVGLGMYMKLLLVLPMDTDVFLVEWPYVAMQMNLNAPRAEEAVLALLTALTARQHSQCCVVAHSLGTVMLSWLCRAHNTRCFQHALARSDARQAAQLRGGVNQFYNLTAPLARQTQRHRGSVMLNSDVLAYDAPGAGVVAASIILDPISFLLFDPTVASVFVYKDPKDALDLCMHYFLSRELFIANALSRHFVWTYNVMFPEDLETRRPCCDRLRRISRREKWPQQLDWSLDAQAGVDAEPASPPRRSTTSRSQHFSRKTPTADVDSVALRTRSASKRYQRSNSDLPAASSPRTKPLLTEVCNEDDDWALDVTSNDSVLSTTSEAATNQPDGHVNPLTEGLDTSVPGYNSQHRDTRLETQRWRDHLKRCAACRRDAAATSEVARHSVLLSSHDSIVPTPKVVAYLREKIAGGDVTSLEVHVATGPHGAMLAQPQWLVHISQRLRHKLDTYYQEEDE